MYVLATGADGYRAVISIAELDPALGNATAIVAYERNGTPLTRRWAREARVGERRKVHTVGLWPEVPIRGAQVKGTCRSVSETMKRLAGNIQLVLSDARLAATVAVAYARLAS
jgi:hypothetical protein